MADITLTGQVLLCQTSNDVTDFSVARRLFVFVAARPQASEHDMQASLPSVDLVIVCAWVACADADRLGDAAVVANGAGRVRRVDTAARPTLKR